MKKVLQTFSVEILKKELWNQVLDYLESNEDTHAIVTGNPGIGKSRSMSYFLRLLLQKKKIVVYEAKKDIVAYIFIPQEDGYKVWSCKYFRPQSCAHLENPDNYYLIDPGTPSNPANVMSHTVLCASPNISHFKEFQKENALLWLMPTWKKEELKILQNEIEINGSCLSDDEFEKRYKMFGGRIRYSLDAYDKYFGHLKDSVKN
jgi:hypothetical protein